MKTILFISIASLGMAMPLQAQQAAPDALDAKMKALQEGHNPKNNKLLKSNKQSAIRKNIDALIPTALGEGFSIVIMPTLNLDYKYAKLQPLTDYNAFYTDSKSGIFLTDLTTIMTWSLVGSANKFLHVGNEVSQWDIGIEGYHFTYVSGHMRYLVFIVRPGKYELVGNSYYLPRTSTPAVNTKSSGKKFIGEVAFIQVPRIEYVQTQAWRDAQYSTEKVTENVCTSVFVASNQCATWGTSTYDVTRQTQAAGNYTDLTATKVPGVKTDINMKKAFASFTVQPGEVVLADGFFAEVPSANYDDAACRQQGADRVDCGVFRHTLTHLPASIEAARTSDAKKRGFPKIAAILQSAAYRPLEINAKRTDKVSEWGPIFSMSP